MRNITQPQKPSVLGEMYCNNCFRDFWRAPEPRSDRVSKTRSRDLQEIFWEFLESPELPQFPKFSQESPQSLSGWSQLMPDDPRRFHLIPNEMPPRMSPTSCVLQDFWDLRLGPFQKSKDGREYERRQFENAKVRVPQQDHKIRLGKRSCRH